MSEHDIIRLSKDPVKLLIWLVILSLCGWLVWNLLTTVLIFSLAALIAYLVSPAIAWLSLRKFPFTVRNIPWWLSTLVVYLLIAGAFVALLFLMVPIVIAQAGQLSSSFPAYAQSAAVSLGKLKVWYARLHVSPQVEANLKIYTEDALARISPTVSALAGHLVGGVLDLVAAAFIAVAAFLVSLYIVMDEKNIKTHFIGMFPQHWQKDTEELMHNVGRVVGAFIRGEILLSLLVGAATYLALLFLKLIGVQFQYALLVSVGIALLYPIPFIGVWGPRVLVPVLAYFELGGWVSAIAVFVAITGVGLIVDNAALPAVMGKGVGISPLMVLLAVFAGGELFGVWGLILSVPAAAILRLIFFYLQKRIAI